MTIPASYVDETPHSAIGYRGLSQSYRMESAGRSGPAQITAPMPNADGLALLQARRLALLVQAERLRNLRRNRDASICEAELRRVTHEILAVRLGKSFPGGLPC
jgi:hypothetical protein